MQCSFFSLQSESFSDSIAKLGGRKDAGGILTGVSSALIKEQMFKYKPLTQVIISYNIYGIIEYYIVYHKLWLKSGFACIPNYHLYFYGKMHSRF